MLQLDPQLIEAILLPLSIQDIISCSLTNRQLHDTIRETPSIQLKLYQKLYQVPIDENDSLHCNPSKRVKDLVERERNILSLTPRITRFPLKRNHLIHSVQGDYIVSYPSSLSPSPYLKSQDRLRFEVCTIYDNSRSSRHLTITVDFEPDLQTLTVDVQKDIVIVCSLDGYIHPLHIHTNNGFTEEYVGGGIPIPDQDWKEGINVKISLIADDRVVVGLGGKWWIFNWKTGDNLGRFPPQKTWESISGSLVSHTGLLIGLDLSRLPWIANNNPIGAYLAIFNISNRPLPPYLPELLLWLPYNSYDLSKIIRKAGNIPKKIKIVVSREHLPILQQSSDPSFIRITYPFKLIPGHTQQELSIVIPIKSLGIIKIESRIKQSPKGRTWRRTTNPFDGVDSIPFQRWAHRAHFFIDTIPKSRSGQKSQLTEGYQNTSQVGSRLFKFDSNDKDMKQIGMLKLDIQDFDHRQVEVWGKQYGALKGLQLDLAPNNGDRPKKPRSDPLNYSFSSLPATPYRSSSMVSSGRFPLGLPGEPQRLIGDSQKLVFQHEGNEKVWILNFAS
ncbi:uncharacterized protein IL334_003539 [Kwoniella shivajii]|uniref:F-box domain-containing protein n=1 Tax=Kwoniella shivajii TaxID=564305 RepID=A0ABZ1CXU7_9TREE|nr:hypothetical protein IL334_003539 [Kwoniella shivajii]